ncbi:MAG: hypothetical protein AAF088_03545 [Pseudomonadota bacterium]
MHLPPDFATTGLAITAGQKPPTRFQVIGERSSGTNLVKRLLGRNTALKPTEDLGWKHGFFSPMAIPADFALVCVVRNAADWALSMHAKPWHTPPAMQALEFSDFIRAEWATIIDRPRYFSGIATEAVGQPLQQDRDPENGAPYPNLFALRSAKLRSHLSITGRHCASVVVRLETVQDDPEKTLEQICSGLGTAVPEGFKPVQRRLGSRFKAAIETRPKTPAEVDAGDIEFLRSQTDTAFEKALGYSC